MLPRALQAARPWARLGTRVYATCRLNLALSIAINQATAALPIPGLGFLLHTGVRLWVASRLSAPPSKAAPESQEAEAAPAPAQPAGNAEARAGPRGLPALPPRPRAAVPLCGLVPAPDHSTRPLGLPMNFLAQGAARGPMYRWQGNRLLRGVLGLAATLLLCRGFPTPFTGRRAWLPPRLFELFYHKVLGPIAAISYLYHDPTQLGAGSHVDRALCEAYAPAIQQAYSRMREVGAAEAARLGRRVAFAAPVEAAVQVVVVGWGGYEGVGGWVVFAALEEMAVQPIQAGSVNACCLPGGIVFVHSGLINAVRGSKQALSFVVGHEVGHAIGRHSLEKATLTYGGLFAIDIVVGLAERLLMQGSRAGSVAGAPPTLPPGPYRLAPGNAARPGASPSQSSFLSESDMEGEGEEGEGGPGRRLLRGLDAMLQSGLLVLQLAQSRRHEYEADALALHLGAHAGMDRSWLASGAQATLEQFIRMEGGQGGLAQLQLGGPADQQDNPLSTHPAAVNRLRRLAEVFRGMAA